MKQSFPETPGLREDLFDLLDVVFPGIRGAAEHAAALGGHWERISTPFVLVEDGRIRSHIGVIELSLVVLGRTVRVGSVHAVATHPDFRRRGHYRRLMEEVLRDCETRYETLILTTENPEYYRPFGFRVVPEHGFRAACAAASPGAAEPPRPLRLLDRHDPRDIARLQRLLEARESVSDVVGIVGDTAVFCFNEGRRPLWYAQDLDVVVCLERQKGRLTLFDVVGPTVPPLGALVDRIPWPVDEILVCFVPDKLSAKATAFPHVFDHDGPSHLMVRGPFAAEDAAFTLPRSART